MGELKNEDEQGVNLTFPSKRKPDEEDALSHSDSKKPKPEALLESKLIKQDDEETDEEEEEEEYEDEDEDDDDEDEDEEQNGEAEVDVKGKGIMKDDKGKGKLIEESEQDDDSSDDDDDAVNASDDSDSDLSDDPLAEVDLDNILPSRTRSRRGASRSGVVIGNIHDKDNDDE